MYKPVGGVLPAQASGGPPPRNRDRLPGKAQKCQFPSIFDRFYKVSRNSPPGFFIPGGKYPPEFAVFDRFYKVFQESPLDFPSTWFAISPKNAVLLTVFQLFGIAGERIEGGGFLKCIVFPRGFKGFHPFRNL